MQDIALDLDKENELVFQLSVEGTKPAKVDTRFLINAGKFSLSFPADRSSTGEVSVEIPALDNVLSEGRYSSSLEVIVDGKVFTPITLNSEFKKSVSIVAEVVTKKKKKSNLSVSSTVSVNNVKMNLDEKNKIENIPDRLEEKRKVSSEIEKEKIKKENIIRIKEEKLKKIKENIVKKAKLKNREKIQETPAKQRSRPVQRSGRPKINRMTSEARKRKILEKYVKDISKKTGKNLTESQILELVEFIKSKGKK